MKHIRAGLATGLLIALAAPVAHADVTVRVEGATQTLVDVAVPRTGPDVVKDGATCSGSSAGGALDRAVNGDWAGTSYSFGLSVDRIRGEDYPFGADKYWNFDLNRVGASQGACDTAVQDGDEVLFFAACAGATTGCSPFDAPRLEATAPATATTGVPFTVSVRQFVGTSAPSASVGATVSGGVAPVSTGADGRATVTVATPGTVNLTVTKGDGVRDSAKVTVTAPGQPTPTPSVSPTPTATPDTKAPRSTVRDFDDGRIFRKRSNAPRTLRVAVRDASGLRSVFLGLTRRRAGRCTAFSDVRGRFVRSTCGEHERFRVGSSKDVSFLLPKRLAKGRYTVTVRATDASGNRERLADGRNRVVFYVR